MTDNDRQGQGQEVTGSGGELHSGHHLQLHPPSTPRLATLISISQSRPSNSCVYPAALYGSTNFADESPPGSHLVAPLHDADDATNGPTGF
ncbi:hypothetical protein N7527_004890 [Penicillium freii]|nr:hypothetical protein N7527_004890 [Penicillium freii]